MPVYVSTPGFADRQRHPRALVLIVGVHAAAIAAVMTAKMELPQKIIESGPLIFIPEPVPPPPPEPTPQPPRPESHVKSTVDHFKPIVPTPQPADTQFEMTQPPQPSFDKIIGTDPAQTFIPPAEPVRVAARFFTPERLIKPPYPVDKQRLEEEATLRLKLSIDERGRVVAVEPIGKVDRSFFEAARKHLIANWRYKPATEDGRPVPSSTVITLTFRLA